MSCTFIDIHTHRPPWSPASEAGCPAGSAPEAEDAVFRDAWRPSSQTCVGDAYGSDARGAFAPGPCATRTGSGEPGGQDAGPVFELRSCQPGAIPATGAFSCGLHPWHLEASRLAEDLDGLRTILGDPRSLALGECGLDRAVATPWELQERAFAAQIALSEEVGKPIVVHCVRSIADVLHWRKRTRACQPWIIHGFQGGTESARQAIRAGLHLSFGRGLLSGGNPHPDSGPRDGPTDHSLARTGESSPSREAERRSGREGRTEAAAKGAPPLDPPLARVEQVFAALPLDRVFLETDEAPVAIEAVYARAAEVRGIALEELAAEMVVNFRRCFPGGKDWIWTG